MKKCLYLLIVVCLLVFRSEAQIQDPSLALQLSADFNGDRVAFFADNRDYCDYHLRIFFTYAEGFEGMSSGISLNTSPGRRQILSYKVRQGATRYSYNYSYAMYRGNSYKKPNAEFTYALPVTPGGEVTVMIPENQEGYQLAFDMPSDTVYACRDGVMCDDELKDNTAKGYKHFRDNMNFSQITLYHVDGSFGEYIFRGAPLVSPGEEVKMGMPIAIIDAQYRSSLRFSVYFLDQNKLKDIKIGNKHSHLRPFFQTENDGILRLINEGMYQCLCTDDMLMQDMSKHEKKAFLKNKSKNAVL